MGRRHPSDFKRFSSWAWERHEVRCEKKSSQKLMRKWSNVVENWSFWPINCSNDKKLKLFSSNLDMHQNFLWNESFLKPPNISPTVTPFFISRYFFNQFDCVVYEERGSDTCKKVLKTTNKASWDLNCKSLTHLYFSLCLFNICYFGENRPT